MNRIKAPWQGNENCIKKQFVQSGTTSPVTFFYQFLAFSRSGWKPATRFDDARIHEASEAKLRAEA